MLCQKDTSKGIGEPEQEIAQRLSEPRSTNCMSVLWLIYLLNEKEKKRKTGLLIRGWHFHYRCKEEHKQRPKYQEESRVNTTGKLNWSIRGEAGAKREKPEGNTKGPVAKMAEVIWEEQLVEGQPSCWAREFRLRVGICHPERPCNRKIWWEPGGQTQLWYANSHLSYWFWVCNLTCSVLFWQNSVCSRSWIAFQSLPLLLV